MRAPAFWWRTHSPGGLLLAPLGSLYGAVAARRLTRAGVRAGIPVICMGNLVAGGAGKTPVALAVAERLRALGRRPVFLTRGYGGTLREATTVDPKRHDARATGDEAQLLAASGPTVVSPRRPPGAAMAATLGDAIVMDDGLQNPSLVKTLSLVVVDAASGVGNGRCIPAGPLRAPLAAQWPLVDVLVPMGDGAAGDALAAEAVRRGRPVIRGRLVPLDPGRFTGRAVFAFAGIGRPEKFFATLASTGATIAHRRTFADHQPYDRRVIARMAEEAQRRGLVLVTTAKDHARLAAVLPEPLLSGIEVLDVAVRFEDPAALDALLVSAVRGA